MSATHWGYISKPENRVLHISVDGDTACGLMGIAMNRYQFADHKPVCLRCLKVTAAVRRGREGE